MKPVLRKTEQHDLGKLAFAFVISISTLPFPSSSSSRRETCRRRFPGIWTAFAVVGE